jgi:hypothetical protein
MKLTKPQQQALLRVFFRHAPNAKEVSYLGFRRTVFPGPGCVMVPYFGMFLGIEPDGYTHS